MKHGIDCHCQECEKTRNLLLKKEKEGEIYISGTAIDKKKLGLK